MNKQIKIPVASIGVLFSPPFVFGTLNNNLGTIFGGICSFIVSNASECFRFKLVVGVTKEDSAPLIGEDFEHFKIFREPKKNNKMFNKYI